MSHATGKEINSPSAEQGVPRINRNWVCYRPALGWPDLYQGCDFPACKGTSAYYICHGHRHVLDGENYVCMKHWPETRAEYENDAGCDAVLMRCD